jgi:uncharacterized glyoxalase superfamily protein PhnB
MKIPPNNQAVMPYLILKDVKRFIDFAAQVFDGQLLTTHYRDESKTIIAHAEIDINGSTIMCAEAVEPWLPQPAGLFIYVEDADDTFNTAVELGAEVVMELSDQEYGRTCGIKDPGGNIWWVTSVN